MLDEMKKIISDKLFQMCCVIKTGTLVNFSAID